MRKLRSYRLSCRKNRRNSTCWITSIWNCYPNKPSDKPNLSKWSRNSNKNLNSWSRTSSHKYDKSKKRNRQHSLHESTNQMRMRSMWKSSTSQSQSRFWSSWSSWERRSSRNWTSTSNWSLARRERRPRLKSMRISSTLERSWLRYLS